MRQILTQLLRATLCVLAIISFSTAARAQFRAGIQGTVTDPAGAVVPEATITLTSKETARSVTATTSSEGFYRFSELAPGTYTLSVEKAGFKKTTLENLVVSAEQVQ